MPKTLLLADDSVTIQKVVGISFANEDVRIVTVDNGDDAITRAKEIRPDIVLADVVMPGKSGYEVCAALKADPELAGIPVLLLTGTFETFDEARAAQVGADGHITKPFESQALVELVSARLADAARPAAASAPRDASPAEPEPFDFLEPPDTTLRPSGSGTASPLPGDADDAFAFDAEPIDLETDAEIDLGSEATAARSTLLLGEEESPFGEGETVQPVAVAEFDDNDDPDDVTRLVLPPIDADGDLDPLADIQTVAIDPFEETERRTEWDVSSDELSDSFVARVIGDTDRSQPSDAHEDATPPVFSAPLFEDEEAAAAEFDLGTEDAPPGSAQELDATATPAMPSELPGALRDQIHETLEKIAWEALGDLSERIVREAVARVEQVAWDVIPRLAETLIREEIRKLKGEE